MSRSLESIEFDIKRRLQYFSDKGIRLAVACSAGKDSMALCEYFYSLIDEFPELKMSVLHINYNLRADESIEDENFIRQWCESKKIDFFLKSVDGSKQSTGIQNWARDVRYSWFKEWCDAHNGVVCIAHHLKDQAETAVFKLARGSELDKISSMSIYSGQYRIWRPFLELDYAQINKLLHGKKIPHREDSSNATIKYSRNRIRHNVMPELKEISADAERKIATASRDISDLYTYVLNVHDSLIRSDNLTFNDLGAMPKSLATLILAKFIKQKIVGYKLKSESINLIYDALLQNEDIDLSLDSEKVAQCRAGQLKLMVAPKPFDSRKKQHEKYFSLGELKNSIPEDADLEIDP